MFVLEQSYFADELKTLIAVVDFDYKIGESWTIVILLSLLLLLREVLLRDDVQILPIADHGGVGQ